MQKNAWAFTFDRASTIDFGIACNGTAASRYRRICRNPDPSQINLATIPDKSIHRSTRFHEIADVIGKEWPASARGSFTGVAAVVEL
jgi:hypothetical protein